MGHDDLRELRARQEEHEALAPRRHIGRGHLPWFILLMRAFVQGKKRSHKKKRGKVLPLPFLFKQPPLFGFHSFPRPPGCA
jgi:hypothetical protein